MQHRSQHKNWMFSFMVIIMALMIATPALAEYLGPNRTVIETTTVCKIILNECKYVEDKGEWKYKTENAWSCSLEGKPWQAYSSQSRPCNDNLHTNGYQYWSREDVTKTETVTYPPATIDSSLQNCTLRNGWCITVPQLSLSGSEPVSGFRIIAIEGILNGQTFACMNASCSVPLNQGNNNFTYWALSSFLDSSEMEALNAKVDSEQPSITFSLSGVLGLNNWYLGPVTFNSSASDDTSGLASFTCTRDGTALGSCNTITVNGDGLHPLILTARDNAGHIRNLGRNIFIDTQDPALNASISGTLGSNTWYTTAKLDASAADPAPGSGLSTFEYNFDGSGWIPFPASGTLDLADGKHTIDLRAVDKAGRTVASSKSFWLDTGAPNVNLDSSGTFGLNDWYTTSPTLTAYASDDTSGLDIFEYSLDNGAWTAYTTPLSLNEGIHSISLWAQDQAGLVTQVDRTYRVDTRAPQIAGSLSGTRGANGWYISDVTIAASASDPLPGSGIDTFIYTLNGGAETAFIDPLSLSDGQYTIQLNARDKAGLSYSIEQTFKVDTIPPSVTIDTVIPSWVKGTITFNGTAGDHGSGLSSVEFSIDGGQTWHAVSGTDSWNTIWNTADNQNGIYEVRVRAIDQAGLSTEQVVNVGVDNLSPEISLPDSWLQWDTVTLNILDNHSGLSEARVEISDPKGRWPTRVIQLDPGQFPLAFKWDRRFGDDAIAEAGTYDVKVFASDNLGNMTDQTASIRVLLDILPPGPTSTQPYTSTVAVNTKTPILSTTATSVHMVTRTSSPTAPANFATPTPSPRATHIVSIFGTIESPVPETSTPATIPTPRTTPTKSNAVEWLQSILAPEIGEERTTEIGSPKETETQPASTNSSVLWGTAATAAIAAATTYIQEERRKREEEKARLKALEEAKEERRKKMKKRKTAKMEAKRAQEAAWEEARQEELSNSYSLHTDLKIARLENEEGALLSLKKTPPVTNSAHSTPTSQDRRAEGKDGLIQEEMNSYTAEPQEWETDYNNYMAQKALEEAAKKEKEASVSQPKKKTWLDKAWGFVDEHQTELALLAGVGVGVLAIVLSGGLAIPAVAAIAGATIGAGVLAAGGTLALNAHFNRPWNENLLSNVALAGGAALLTSGAGFLFQAVATGLGSYCAVNQSTCARVEPVFKAIDIAEETWLNAKLAYQTWSGNQAGAAETALELYMESVDGGMPGNAVTKELGEQISDLGKNATAAINKYGDEVLPLLIKHGDEALEIIQKYGDDGIALLQKYGDNAINLINSYGDPAIKVLGAVDPKAAKELLQSLDDDVLDYAIEQGPDAVAALSKWSPKDLRLHGPELALRAKKDAKVLAAIKKLKSLGPIDPKNLTKEQKALIDAIAANSTQYADEGQVVLGKWVDYGGGFVETAQGTGSVHYNPHPDMWNSLSSLGEAKQEEVAWLINQQVIQSGIAKGSPFEYTLNGIPTDTLSNEQAAVRAIFSGKSDEEIMQLLESDKMPIRMKELQELQKAGYEYTFDNVSKSYVLVK